MGHTGPPTRRGLLRLLAVRRLRSERASGVATVTRLSSVAGVTGASRTSGGVGGE